MNSNNIAVAIATTAGEFIDSAQIGDAIIRTSQLRKFFLQVGEGALSGFAFDVSNNVGLGKAIPGEKFDVSGFVKSSSGYKIDSYANPIIDLSGNILTPGNFDMSGNFAVNTNKFTVSGSTGNTYVKGTLDISGNQQVTGTATFGSRVNAQSNMGVAGTLDVSNNFSVDTNVLYVDTSNNRVGVNTSNPSFDLHVVGNTRIEGSLTVNGTTTIIDTNVNTTEQLLVTNDGTGPAIIINQIGAQAVADFQDDGVSALFIADGGLIGIGTTTPTVDLDVIGNATVSDTLKALQKLGVGTNGTPQATVDISGNLLMNSGKFSIDVSGNVKSAGSVDLSDNLRVNTNKFMVDSNGNTDISGNLTVAGLSTLNNNVQVNANLGVSQNIDVSNNLRVNTNKFIVDSNGNMWSAGSFDLSNNLRVNTNKLVVDSNGNLWSAGNIDLSNNLRVNTNKFVVDNTGNVSAAGSIDLSNNLRVNTNKFVVDPSGNMSSAGTFDLSSNFRVNTNKFMVDPNGNTDISGVLTVANNTYLNNNTLITGNLGVTQNIDVSNNLRVNTNKFIVDSNGNMWSAGSFDLSNNLRVNTDKLVVDSNGNLWSAGNIDLSNNLRVNTNKFVVDASGNMWSAGSFDLSNNLRVNNDKFVVAPSGNTLIAGTLDISKNTTIGTNVLYVDVTNKRAGVNNSAPVVELDISGNINTNKAFVGQNDISDNAIFGYKGLNKLTEFALTQTNTGKTIVNSKAGQTIEFSHNGNVKQTLYENGNVVIAGNIFTYSDARLKTNVVTIPSALDKVQNMRGVTYTMIADGESGPSHVGLIAQEVEAIIPEAITEDNGYKTVAYGNLVGVLIEAIKELNEKVINLSSRIVA